MPWARLDDAFWAHPKVVAAGLEATGLHCRALSYVAAQGAGGHLPRDIVKMLASSRWKTLAAKCVSAGLWHVDGDDWEIHDYADPAYGNPSSPKALARKEAAKKAAAARWDRPPPDANGMRSASDPHSNMHTEPHANGNADSNATSMRRDRRAAESQSQSQSPFVEGKESPSSAVKEPREPETADLSDLQKQEITRLAAAVNAMRPGIDKPQIEFQAARLLRAGKSWTRIAIAIIAVCLDPETKYANRISLKEGYWWRDDDTRTQKALTRWVEAGHRNPADALGVR